MLGKLLKYDFKSMWKQFAFVWPAALALAAIARLTLGMSDTQNPIYYGVRGGRFVSALAGVTTLVLVGVLFAMFVIAVIFAIQRFYKGLLGDEGYLMHTLPVKPWQLIVSKLLCAQAATFVSVLVALAAIAILLWKFVDLKDLFWGARSLFTGYTGGELRLLWAEVLALALVQGIQSYLQLYAAMSIGHLFRKDRVVISAIAYVAINACLSFLRGLFRLVPDVGVIGGADGPVVIMGSLQAAVWIQIAWALVLSAVFFLVTNYVLRQKLNLE